MINWLKKNKTNLILVLVVLAVGYWLGQGQSPIPPTFRTAEIAPQMLTEEASFGVEKTAAEPEADEEGGSPSERMVIKSGALSLLVKAVRESVDQMQKLATDLSGFVVDSQITIVDEKKQNLRATVTIRVPSEKFDEALNTLKNSAVKVTSERTSGQDVTEEYTDLQSRLRNLEATETQLLKIMEQAGEIKDVLSVQQELTRVRGQIETTKGRIKFLEESAALSRITAHFATEEEELPLVGEQWQPLATAKAALRSLISFGQTVADKLIFVLIFFSPVIVIALVIWVVRFISATKDDRTRASKPRDSALGEDVTRRQKLYPRRESSHQP